MMFKRFAFLILVIATSALIMNYSLKHELVIDAPIVEISQQLNDPKRWIQWNSKIISCKKIEELKVTDQKPTFTLTCGRNTWVIDRISLTEFHVSTTGQNNFDAHIFIRPGQNNKTVLTTIQRIPLYQHLIRKFNKSNDATEINELKLFIEDPKQFYGFKIAIRPVVDTSVVVIKKRIVTSERYSALSELFNALRRYTNEKNVDRIAFPMASYSKAGNDSINITAMYAIDQEMKFYKGDFNFRKMPKNGRMLIGDYSGRYKDRHLLYSAMERYISDKNLSTVATPYEKYIDGAPPHSDSCSVSMEIYIPIY